MSEAIIHKQICNYIRMQYPDVIFTSEPSGMRLPIGQAKKLKDLRSGNKLPDLWILEPRGTWHGLLIELKAKDAKKTKRSKEQALMLRRLIGKGYYAQFAWGFDAAKQLIDEYFKLKQL